MPIDPRIILGIQAPQFKVSDPLESAHKSLALQALMGQQDMQAMQMRQAQQAEADDAATREAYRGAGGDTSKVLEALQQRGLYKPAQALEKSMLDKRKTLADLNKTELEGAAKRADIYRNVLSGVRSQEDLDAALLNPVVAAEFKERGVRPVYSPEFIRGQVLTADKFLDAVKPHITMVTSNGQQIPVDTNPWSNPGITQQRFSSADPGKDLVLPDGQGGYRPNAPLVGVKKDIASAGRAVTNVSVNTSEKPFLTQLGEGVGKNIIADFDQARSAVQTLNNARQIETSLNNVISGPGATARVTLAQIGQALGINGKDATEQLVNTRMAIQGLARQELAAAGQMKGQGQITEGEREILRKAEAGNINEMTVPELRAYLSAIRKTANYKIGLHSSNIERLKKNPNAAPVVDFLNVNVPDQGPAQVDPAAVDAALKKHGQSR